MADKKTTGSHFWDKIDTFVKNVATLDVVTLTGTIQLDLKQPPPNGAQADDSSWKKLLLYARAAGPQQAEPVAISHFEFDQDAVLFVKEGATENQKELLELHNQTVATAQKMRAQVIEAAMNIFD